MINLTISSLKEALGNQKLIPRNGHKYRNEGREEGG